MSLARIAWITVTGICAIAALLLLVNGYDGYSAVLAVIGLSAAVNLLGEQRPRAGTDSEHKTSRPGQPG